MDSSPPSRLPRSDVEALASEIAAELADLNELIASQDWPDEDKLAINFIHSELIDLSYSVGICLIETANQEMQQWSFESGVVIVIDQAPPQPHLLVNPMSVREGGYSFIASVTIAINGPLPPPPPH